MEADPGGSGGTGPDIHHPDPSEYISDIQDALDKFEEALTKRYKDDLNDRYQVWTPQGEKPSDPEEPEGRESDLKWNRAKKVAPDWAAEVRALVASWVPDCDTQNLRTLNEAHLDLGSSAKRLASDDLSELTNYITASGDRGEPWEGIASDSFSDTVGQHVEPTRKNQEAIAASLYTLYAGRMLLIDSARRNVLSAIGGATRAIRETDDSEEIFWEVTKDAASIVIGLTSPYASIALGAASMVEEYLLDKDPPQEYSNGIEEVITQLEEKLKLAEDDNRNSQSEWLAKVNDLQDEIEGKSNADLEMYDITGGTGQSPRASGDGFDVSVQRVYELSSWCFEASQLYEEIIPKVIATEKADADLKGIGNEVSDLDSKAIETRDALLSFVQTTCARYYEVGCLLAEAARTYSGVETDNEAILTALEDEPNLDGDEPSGGTGSVDDHLGETDLTDIEDGDEDDDTEGGGDDSSDGERQPPEHGGYGDEN